MVQIKRTNTLVFKATSPNLADVETRTRLEVHVALAALRLLACLLPATACGGGDRGGGASSPGDFGGWPGETWVDGRIRGWACQEEGTMLPKPSLAQVSPLPACSERFLPPFTFPNLLGRTYLRPHTAGIMLGQDGRWVGGWFGKRKGRERDTEVWCK